MEMGGEIVVNKNDGAVIHEVSGVRHNRTEDVFEIYNKKINEWEALATDTSLIILTPVPGETDEVEYNHSVSFPERQEYDDAIHVALTSNPEYRLAWEEYYESGDAAACADDPGDWWDVTRRYHSAVENLLGLAKRICYMAGLEDGKRSVTGAPSSRF